jgi:cytochrome c-type biogenesis protein CcmE
MKKTHIIILIVIAGAVGILVTTAGEASSYVSFNEAYALASNGNDKNIHVVGQLKKDMNGNVIGIEEGADRVSFSFIMIDDNGKEQTVTYDEPMPADFTKSEKVVVIGSYAGENFKASKILLKCPSKYQEEKVNI